MKGLGKLLGAVVVIGVVLVVFFLKTSAPQIRETRLSREGNGGAHDHFALFVRSEPGVRIAALGHSARTDRHGDVTLELPVEAIALGTSQVKVTATRDGFLEFGRAEAMVDANREPRIAWLDAKLHLDGQPAEYSSTQMSADDRGTIAIDTAPGNTLTVAGKPLDVSADGHAALPIRPLDAVLDLDLTKGEGLSTLTDEIPVAMSVRTPDGTESGSVVKIKMSETLAQVRGALEDVAKTPIPWAQEASARPRPAILVICRNRREDTHTCNLRAFVAENGLTRARDVAAVVLGEYVDEEVEQCGRYGDVGQVTVARTRLHVRLRAFDARTAKLLGEKTLVGPMPRACKQVEDFEHLENSPIYDKVIDGGPIDDKALSAWLASL